MAISLIPYKKQEGALVNLLRFFKESYRDFFPIAIVLVLVVAAYIGFSVMRNSTRAQVDTLVNEREKLVASLKSKKIQDVQNFAQQARGLNEIVRQHSYASKFLPMFEKSVHNNVNIDSISFDDSKAELTVQASAPSFDVIAEQFLIWRNGSSFLKSSEIQKFEKIETTGLITFDAKLVINREFLRKQ